MAFNYFVCPECNFQAKTPPSFEMHAIENHPLAKKLFDPEAGVAYEDPAPNLFSFNSPFGACPTCDGLGHAYDVSWELLVPNPQQSVEEGGIRFLGKPRDIFALDNHRFNDILCAITYSCNYAH